MSSRAIIIGGSLWLAATAISLPATVLAASKGGASQNAPAEIADYCKNKTLPAMMACGKECTAAFGSPFSSDAGMKCQNKCMGRAEKEAKACAPEASRKLSAEFLGDAPNVDGYCAHIYGEARTTQVGLGYPSVMADESYDKAVAKCVTSVNKRLSKKPASQRAKAAT